VNRQRCLVAKLCSKSSFDQNFKKSTQFKMARTKQTPKSTPVKATGQASTFNASSPRRKMKEVSKLSGGSVRGTRRINCIRTVKCREGCQLFLVEVPNKIGMEGFTRDLSNMVSSKNERMVDLNINHSGELKALDGSDSPRNNQRGYWIKSPVRMADEPETDEQLVAGEKIAEVSLTCVKIVDCESLLFIFYQFC
jgi:hypothetical protein